MNTWIPIPFTKRVVVKNDAHQCVCIVVRGNRPKVVCKNYEYYPRSWQGRRGGNGETVTWDFALGPVRSLLIHKDKKNNLWVQVVWK